MQQPKKNLKNTKNTNLLISCILSIVAVSLIFVGGIFYSNTHTEKIADYATRVVKNNTVNKKYCCLTVGSGSKGGSLPDPASEFHNLYGVFKQEKITFASAINADKGHEIRFLNNLSDNLSFFYLGPIGTVQYNNHYKHYIYPIETMFPFSDVKGISDYSVSISQTHANKLLQQNGEEMHDGDFSLNQYKNLLNTPITIQIDGNPFVFGIQNIFFETDYYYEGLADVMGDFVLCSYFLPNNLHRERKNLYFMSEYTYQNRYFMSYINDVYTTKDFDIKVNHFNIANDIDDEYMLSFYYSKTATDNDWISIMLFIISGAILSTSLLFAIKQTKIGEKTLSLLPLIFLFTPYLVFLLLFKVTKDLALFSETSTKLNAIYIIAFISLYFIINSVLAFRKRRLSIFSNNLYYELNI